MEQGMKSKFILHICCAIIVLVASIDTYWLSKNSDIIIQVEQNPIGQYLIELDNGDVSFFIFSKFIGTYMCVWGLYFAWKCCPKKINLISIVVAMLQLLLLFYLYQIPSFIF